MLCSNPYELNQPGIFNLNIPSHVTGIEDYYAAMRDTNRRMHDCKPDERKCNEFAEKALETVDAKEKPLEDTRFQKCVLATKGTYANFYERYVAFFRQIEFMFDEKSRWKIMQRTEAEHKLNEEAYQVIVHLIPEADRALDFLWKESTRRYILSPKANIDRAMKT